MKIYVDEIDSIECLGELEADVYDIGMEDSPHTFFANGILVHNSAFASSLPIVLGTMPEVNINDEKQMTKATLQIASDVQSYINKIFDIMAVRFFNLKEHTFNIKQELISKTSFFMAKKRYAQLVINKGGIVLDEHELEIKGIDVVRTSFPIKFREFLKNFIENLLNKVEYDEICKNILEFKEKMTVYKVFEIAKNTSVNFKSGNNTTNYDPKNRIPFRMENHAPAQVKAALYYNDLLKMWNLDKDSPPIFSGQKIKWVYMKKNEYGIDGLAMKADGTDPDQILDFLEKYADRSKMYESELEKKLVGFFNVLNWNFPNEDNITSEEFFEF